MRKVAIIMALILCFTPVAKLEAEGTETYNITYDKAARASRIISASGWSLGRSHCGFTLYFLNTSTGSGVVTLQKQSGNSWVYCGQVSIKFENVRSMDGSISVNNLSSGTYRLEFDLDVSPHSEIIYSSTKSI